MEAKKQIKGFGKQLKCCGGIYLLQHTYAGRQMGGCQTNEEELILFSGTYIPCCLNALMIHAENSSILGFYKCNIIVSLCSEPEQDPPSYTDVRDEEPVLEAVTSTQVSQVQTSITTSTSSTSEFAPRLCHIKKRADFNGYGFNLHAERDKPGQYIGKIDEDSPAERADLREGDRIVAVNGTNIESETHQRVIELVKSGGDETTLLVLDKDADEYYKARGITVSTDLDEVRRISSVKGNIDLLWNWFDLLPRPYLYMFNFFTERT